MCYLKSAMYEDNRIIQKKQIYIKNVIKNGTIVKI